MRNKRPTPEQIVTLLRQIAVARHMPLRALVDVRFWRKADIPAGASTNKNLSIN